MALSNSVKRRCAVFLSEDMGNVRSKTIAGKPAYGNRPQIGQIYALGRALTLTTPQRIRSRAVL
jgi:hypothetical protein